MHPTRKPLRFSRWDRAKTGTLSSEAQSAKDAPSSFCIRRAGGTSDLKPDFIQNRSLSILLDCYAIILAVFAVLTSQTGVSQGCTLIRCAHSADHEDELRFAQLVRRFLHEVGLTADWRSTDRTRLGSAGVVLERQR